MEMSTGEANCFPITLEQVCHVPRRMSGGRDAGEAEPFPIKGRPILECTVENNRLGRWTKVTSPVDAEFVTELGPPFSKTCRFFEKVAFLCGHPDFGRGAVDQAGALELFAVVVGKENSIDFFDSKSFELAKEFTRSPVDDKAGISTPDQIGVTGIFLNEQEGQIFRVDPFDFFPEANR